MEDDKINLLERWGSQNGAGSCGGTATQSIKKNSAKIQSNSQPTQGQQRPPNDSRIMTKEDKLIKCIRSLLDKNMKEAMHSNNKTLL